MDVTFVVDAAFVPWCAAAIRSCLDHAGSGLIVHIVHDGSITAETGRERLARLVEGGGATLRLYAVDESRFAALPITSSLGRVVWVRCLLPELLIDTRRVLYLDADTLVVDDLAPLTTPEFDGAGIAGVPNVVTPDDRPRIEALGLDPRRYLNAGVMLLDLEQLRAEDTSA